VVIILMAIGDYFIGGYWCVLMVIMLMAIVAILLMVIGGYYINGYWWLFYWWILVCINGYYVNGYWWLFINGCSCVLMVIILMAIGGYLLMDVRVY